MQCSLPTYYALLLLIKNLKYLLRVNELIINSWFTFYNEKGTKIKMKYCFKGVSFISIDSHTARFATPPTHPIITRSWWYSMDDYYDDLRASPSYESE